MVTIGLAARPGGPWSCWILGSASRAATAVHPPTESVELLSATPRCRPTGSGRVVVAAVVLIAVGLFFQKSRHGVAMRAVADDQQAAMVQGISVQPGLRHGLGAGRGAGARSAACCWPASRQLQRSSLEAFGALRLPGGDPRRARLGPGHHRRRRRSSACSAQYIEGLLGMSGAGPRSSPSWSWSPSCW